MQNLKYGKDLHKQYPKTCDPKDFWGQICRTVNGEAISEEQISLIYEQICTQLKFIKKDNILDLGCGNGALSTLFFEKIESFLGIDFSEYLIDIAKDNFEKNEFIFKVEDAVDFCSTALSIEKFNKVLCYGAFAYFDDTQAIQVLTSLNKRFNNVDLVFIGNLPDRDKADSFYHTKELKNKYLDDPQSSIGHWRSKNKFKVLAESCGWHTEFIHMPTHFYAAHYRYDVLLTRINIEK